MTAQPTQFDRLISARVALVFEFPFFGALAMRLKVRETLGMPTAATDGQHLYFNPAFTATLPFDELVAVTVHEIMHCACGHIWRRGSRDAKRANIAMDLAINPIIRDAGFKLPKDCLMPGQPFGGWSVPTEYEGQSFEWIYDRLPDDLMKQIGKGTPSDTPGAGGEDVQEPGSGDGTPGDGQGNGTAGSVDGVSEADWKQAVQQAAAVAKMRGKFPASLQRFAADTAKPVVDWRSVLHRFIQQCATDDYTWRRPSRRYLPSGLYLPSLYSEAVGPLVIAVDTSGSIDDLTVSQFAAEIRAITDEVKPERVHVIYCDAAIHREDVFERGEHVTIDPVGGGGTSHVPVMDFVDGMDEPPVALICLTDLYTGHREEPPACPVLWATIGSTEAPYGEIVEVK